jgi:predicted enzyme related to lactoylglutathione lyase/ketosteroid isomerase-like protein
MTANTDVVERQLAAYRARDREAAAALLAEDFRFTSPQDDHIDKDDYLERCFPTADRFAWQRIEQLVEAQPGLVLLRYRYELVTGGTYSNAEAITVRGGLIADVQVYFGGPAEPGSVAPAADAGDTFDDSEHPDDDGRPVVHFEIIGHDPGTLRGFYGSLFGWHFHTPSPVAPAVSEAEEYGFLDLIELDGVGIRGGIGGGAGFDPHAIFYVFVPDVAAALAQAERLGATRAMAPAVNPSDTLVVAHFRDPEGTLIGLAGPR